MIMIYFYTFLISIIACERRSIFYGHRYILNKIAIVLWLCKKLFLFRHEMTVQNRFCFIFKWEELLWKYDLLSQKFNDDGSKAILQPKTTTVIRTPFSVSNLALWSKNWAAWCQTAGWCVNTNKHCSVANITRRVTNAVSSLRSGFDFSNAIYFFHSSTYDENTIKALE